MGHINRIGEYNKFQHGRHDWKMENDHFQRENYTQWYKVLARKKQIKNEGNV